MVVNNEDKKRRVEKMRSSGMRISKQETVQKKAINIHRSTDKGVNAAV